LLMIEFVEHGIWCFNIPSRFLCPPPFTLEGPVFWPEKCPPVDTLAPKLTFFPPALLLDRHEPRGRIGFPGSAQPH
jgi:hypothetical protein